MYHIKSDKRSQRSAQVICQTFLNCLREDGYGNISVTRIQQRSYISRATFYRLFDSVSDVLSYLCDQIFEEICENCQKLPACSSEDVLLAVLRRWMQEDMLLKAMIGNQLSELLHASALRVLGEHCLLICPDPQLPAAQLPYLQALSGDLLSCVLRVWLENGQQETPEQLLDLLKGVGRLLCCHFDNHTISNSESGQCLRCRKEGDHL